MANSNHQISLLQDHYLRDIYFWPHQPLDAFLTLYFYDLVIQLVSIELRLFPGNLTV